jgi:hypothetical protein
VVERFVNALGLLGAGDVKERCIKPVAKLIIGIADVKRLLEIYHAGVLSDRTADPSGSRPMGTSHEHVRLEHGEVSSGGSSTAGGILIAC